MSRPETQQTYAADAVVDVYDHDRLQQAELLLFEQYVRPGLSILDIGVGAGRTTAHLASGAARYVGLDYSRAMIDRCRRKFPGLEFIVGDASDLSQFDGAWFDLVLFSFNGLGSLQSDADRRRCLSEIARVLKGSSVFLFSLHNPRFLVTRPRLFEVEPLRKLWRLAYVGFQTARNAPRLLSRAFWKGEGYLIDRALHGGLRVYVCAEHRLSAQLGAAGLTLLQRVPAPEVDGRCECLVPWYYYAARKAAPE